MRSGFHASAIWRRGEICCWCLTGAIRWAR